MIRELTSTDQPRQRRAVKTVLQNVGTSSTRADIILNSARFTKYMATPSNEYWAPTIKSFTVTEERETLVVKSIERAIRSKATGPDEIFAEALWVELETTTKLISAICENGGS